MSGLILQVKELLPDLQENFIQVSSVAPFDIFKAFLNLKFQMNIQICLKHYDFNPEAVINAVLEDNLPPHLNEGHSVPDSQPIPEVFVGFEEPTDISKKTRTKYFIKSWLPLMITIYLLPWWPILQDRSFQWNAGSLERQAGYEKPDSRSRRWTTCSWSMRFVPCFNYCQNSSFF